MVKDRLKEERVRERLLVLSLGGSRTDGDSISED